MAQLDRPGRAACCISPSPTPSPTPYTPYVSPACELSNDDIENIIASMEAYMNDPDTDLPYPNDQTIDELQNDCKRAQTREQRKRIRKLEKEFATDLSGLITIMAAVGYGMASIFEDVYTNRQSRFLESAGGLVDQDLINEEIDFEDGSEPTTIKQSLETIISQKDIIAETLPNAITNAIDNWVKNGKLSLVDKIRLSVNRKTKDFFEFAIGEDVGFVIGPGDLQKFKDSGWGNLTEEFIENPNG